MDQLPKTKDPLAYSIPWEEPMDTLFTKAMRSALVKEEKMSLRIS
jgi:hypothetical protein